MKLGQLLKHLDTLACTADPELEIRGISYDSRKTQPGDLFVAIKGLTSDGHRFIPTAMEKGATAVLCEDAPCARVCRKGIPVDKIIRSINFNNPDRARYLLGDNPCVNCIDGDCINACNRRKVDFSVDISRIATYVSKLEYKEPVDVNISSDLCGVACENPFFLSSSVVGSNYEMVAKAFEMGWAGVAFKTIGMFVPDEVSPRFDQLEKEDTSFVGFKNIEQISDHSLEENLGFFRKLKEN